MTKQNLTPEETTSVKAKFLERVDSHLPSSFLTESMRAKSSTARSSLKLLNRIAFIGGSEIENTLSRYCSVLPVSVDDDPKTLNWQNMDLLLVVAQILPRAEGWRRALLDIEGEAHSLKRLMRAAKSFGLTVILWVREEADAEDMFAHLFNEADHVLVPEHSAKQDGRFVKFPEAVDVKVFNPFLDRPQMRGRQMPFVGFLVDGCHDLAMRHGPEEASRRLEPLFKYNWWLTDSSVDLRNADHKVHAIMRRRFLGSMRGEALAKPLSLALSYILPSAMTDGRASYAKARCLEAAASKTCVVTDGDLDFPFLTSAKTPDDLAAFCEWAIRDRIGREGVQHLAWRHAVKSNTYFEALEKILRLSESGPRYSETMNPRINVVVPTIRPDLIPYIIKTVEAQTLKNVKLSIVVNDTSVPAEMRRAADASEITSLHTMPSYRSIGYCMNYGIDQDPLDYWAKFDDDDIYGPNYLSDMLLQRKYLDFDISGKASIFTYFEAEDRLNVRRIQNRDTLNHSIGGGTILARTDDHGFPEDVRGYADTLYLTEALEMGRTIVSADPFNFVQVRRANPMSHTWTAGAQQLNLQGPQRKGSDLTGVIL